MGILGEMGWLRGGEEYSVALHSSARSLSEESEQYHLVSPLVFLEKLALVWPQILF